MLVGINRYGRRISKEWLKLMAALCDGRCGGRISKEWLKLMAPALSLCDRDACGRERARRCGSGEGDEGARRASEVEVARKLTELDFCKMLVAQRQVREKRL